MTKKTHAGKIPHIGISVKAARTCLFVFEYYQDMEGTLRGEEEAAYKEIMAKLKHFNAIPLPPAKT